MVALTNDQIFTLVVIERTGGALSLFALALLFLFYGLFKRLRTVPNTFIMFASIANIGASTASLIAYNGIWDGVPSALCQAQGFLFQMFMQSDPWWSLSMAINVFMVFFMGSNPQAFHKWCWAYCLVCYGGPFILAMVCLELKDPSKGLVYGNAGMWCWVSNDWSPLRIYTYYMLIWICIIASGIIYICVGYQVFRARNRVNKLMHSGYGTSTSVTASAIRSPMKVERGSEWPLPHNQKGSKTGAVEVFTEVRITSSSSESAPTSTIASPGRTYVGFKEPPYSTDDDEYDPREKPYTQQARSDSAPNRLQPNSPNSPNNAGNQHFHRPRGPGIHTTVTSPPRPGMGSRADTPYRSDGQGNGNSARDQQQQGGKGQRPQAFFSRFVVLDPVKRAYLRTSFLFAISVLVTWTPSSINRIRGLIYGDSPYPLNVASATVLPLQGVWNAVIFFVTSWSVVRACVADAVGNFGRERERRRRRDGRGVVVLRDRNGDGLAGRGFEDWSYQGKGDTGGLVEMKGRRGGLEDGDASSDDMEARRPPTARERESWDFADVGLDRPRDERGRAI